MNIKKLIEKLSENMIAKVICVVLAMSIYVFHRITILDKHSISIPLTVTANGVMTNINDVPHFVKVFVRTKTENAAAISSSKIKASINLDYFSEPGQYSVPVDITLTPDIMLIDPLEVIVKPENISVKLDEKITAYIDVKPSVSGEVKHGYAINAITVTPSTVKVVGASSVIKGLKQVYTAKVNVKGAATDFSTTLKLDNIVPVVHVYPESDFTVAVDIEPLPMDKTFSDIKVIPFNLKDGLQIVKEPEALSFTISGPMPLVENYVLPAGGVSIDCSDIYEAGVYELPVSFTLANGLKITKKSSETASIEIGGKIISEDTEE